LEFLPTLDRLLDQDLLRRRLRQAKLDDAPELLRRPRRPAAGPSERERGPDHQRQADLLADLLRLGERARASRPRGPRPDLGDRPLEEVAVLGEAHRDLVRADQPDVAALEDAALRQREREVQRGLAADGRKNRVGPLLLEDPLQKLGRQRLDVGRVGELRVRHDRRRVRVDEDHAVALAAQRADRLCAGVVEFAGLPDDDRAGADDEDASYVDALGHRGASLAAPPASLRSTDYRLTTTDYRLRIACVR